MYQLARFHFRHCCSHHCLLGSMEHGDWHQIATFINLSATSAARLRMKDRPTMWTLLKRYVPFLSINIRSKFQKVLTVVDNLTHHTPWQGLNYVLSLHAAVQRLWRNCCCQVSCTRSDCWSWLPCTTLDTCSIHSLCRWLVFDALGWTEKSWLLLQS